MFKNGPQSILHNNLPTTLTLVSSGVAFLAMEKRELAPVPIVNLQIAISIVHFAPCYICSSEYFNNNVLGKA